MDFSEKIKKLRLEKNLTQEQFGQKLNVTRQAISNWENNKNLPDIQMLLSISEIYDISLDELIKGEEKMNDIQKKIINDGSENKRAKYNMITSVVGLVLIVLGIMLIFIKANSVEYVDAQGYLHENFFLLPLGFGSIFCGIICFLSIGLKTLFSKIKSK